MRTKKYISIIAVAILLMVMGCTETSSNREFDQLVQSFQSPTDDNSLWCYWYWIGDDISKEGITKDLEAMKEAGIGAAFIGNINPE